MNMSNPILSKGSGEKVRSPENLNDYIKVSNIGVWAILGVLLLLLISVFVWGYFGSLKQVITTTGIAENGTVVCYVEEADQLQAGNEVKIGDLKGKVVSVSDVPLNAKDINEKYDAYTAYVLDVPEWAYQVTISCEGCEDGMNTLKIIYNTVQPASYIKG